jgi:hypothetical protein
LSPDKRGKAARAQTENGWTCRFCGRKVEDMDLPQRFPYNLQWRIILFGLAFGSAMLICGKILNYWIIAWVFGIPFVIFALLLAVRRLAFSKFLQLEQDSLLIPKGFLRTWNTKISYADIENGWERASGSIEILVLQVKGRTFEINSMMLPDMASYVAVRDFVKSRFTSKEEPKIVERGKYCFQCSCDGNGEIYNSIGEILWQTKTQHFHRPHYPYGFFRLPDFVVHDPAEKEVCRIKLKRRFALAEFVMTEDGVTVCTIKQKNILRNKYTLEFANGQKWIFRMPLFTVNFSGISEAGEKIYARLWAHEVWYVLIDVAADNPQLAVALTFIHRERQRFA